MGVAAVFTGITEKFSVTWIKRNYTSVVVKGVFFVYLFVFFKNTFCFLPVSHMFSVGAFTQAVRKATAQQPAVNHRSDTSTLRKERANQKHSHLCVCVCVCNLLPNSILLHSNGIKDGMSGAGTGGE